MESLSLLELNEYIQRVYALNFPEALWVHFELSNVKNSRGNLYFDCIEKDDQTDDILAHQGGAIWRRQLSFIKKKLGKVAEDILDDGVVVSAKVRVDFHTRYGAKLIIEDIDPSYTFGQLALEREKTIEKLRSEGLFDLNREKETPLVLQRIAVVSNETAAGYQDFLDQLENNHFGYAFDIDLFESALQGKQVEFEVPYQLEEIANEENGYDLVVMIRGGGSKLDLSAFDNYKVCAAVARMPLPVWTGIGHEIDESVSDMVSHRALKTPTAAAEAIIQHNYHFESSLTEALSEIGAIASGRINHARLELNHAMTSLGIMIENRLERASTELESYRQDLGYYIRKQIDHARWNLDSASQQIDLLDPWSILSKGFLLAEKNGKRIKEVKSLKVRDELEIHFMDGSAISEVKKIKK